jgi:hypothetical protein
VRPLADIDATFREQLEREQKRIQARQSLHYCRTARDWVSASRPAAVQIETMKSAALREQESGANPDRRYVPCGPWHFDMGSTAYASRLWRLPADHAWAG